MKGLFVLFAFFSVAYAGIGVLTPEIEAEALRLWQSYCDGASEGGTDGATLIYCKRSGEKIEETQQHELTLTPAAGQSEQVVFVQSPSYHYKHDVVVSGGGSQNPKTTIFVKSPSNTHEVNVEDKTEQAAAPQKPTLYFLKGNHGGEDVAAGARARRDHGAVNADQYPVVQAQDLDLPIVQAQPQPAQKKPIVYIWKMGSGFQN